MATMSQTWSIFATILLLAVQLCIGDKACTIWSSAGPVVQRETTFTVYCRFNCKCKGSMWSGHPPASESHETKNSTTIFFKVVNITKNKTFSCQCNCSPALDPCGMDISTGYPPDRPKNLSCIYKVKNNEGGDVFCAWNRGRDTFLGNTSKLWVRTVSRNRTDELQVACKGTDSPSGSFAVSTSVQLISVWVHVQNPLGAAVSSITNYTLRDIVMPSTPELVRLECLSRTCSVKVKQSVRTQHLEIQYATQGQMWTTHSYQGSLTSSVQDWSISSLEPYRLYYFRARGKFSTGLWSPWSANISHWTQEEAPAKELDLWYVEPASDSKSLRVYWKEANTSVTGGKIIGYELRVCDPDSGCDSVVNISADARNCLVPFCPSCQVTVWARNAKGLSPPARIITRYTKAEPPQDVRVKAGVRSVAISWRKPQTTPLPAAYVVEWFPEGHKLEELRWMRLSGNDDRAVITDMKPFDCYEGAVYVFWNENSASSFRFTGIATNESAPAAGPLVQETVEGHRLTVTWKELHRSHRMGCITKYTIYLQSGSDQPKAYSVPASERAYVIGDLPPSSYTLWMTASTAQGESPAGQTFRFFIQKSQLSLLLVCGVTSVILLFLMCLCQTSAVKQRFWMFFQCLMLDVVPDPANSKWAKECSQEKGKMHLQVQLSSSSVAKEEEEPILVDVEELPKRINDPAVSTRYPSQTLQSPDSGLATLLYPLTTYIKSFSQDSDSSEHTHTSMDTNTTDDYISSGGPGNMDDEDEETEEELPFFPCHMEQQNVGGKLTLDAVKIDGSDLFQNM